MDSAGGVGEEGQEGGGEGWACHEAQEEVAPHAGGGSSTEV